MTFQEALKEAPKEDTPIFIFDDQSVIFGADGILRRESGVPSPYILQRLPMAGPSADMMNHCATVIEAICYFCEGKDSEGNIIGSPDDPTTLQTLPDQIGTTFNDPRIRASMIFAAACHSVCDYARQYYQTAPIEEVERDRLLNFINSIESDMLHGLVSCENPEACIGYILDRLKEIGSVDDDKRSVDESTKGFIFSKVCLAYGANLHANEELKQQIPEIQAAMKSVLKKEMQQWFADIGFPEISPDSATNFHLTDTHKQQMAEKLEHNWQALIERVNSLQKRISNGECIDDPFLEIMSPDPAAYGVRVLTPANNAVLKDFWQLYQDAPDDMKPLLALSWADSDLKVVFFTDMPISSITRAYLPGLSVGGYNASENIVYLPKKQPLEANITLPDMFKPIDLKSRWLANQESASTRSEIWYEEMLHAALNCLYENNTLPFPKNDISIARKAHQALIHDLRNIQQSDAIDPLVASEVGAAVGWRRIQTLQLNTLTPEEMMKDRSPSQQIIKEIPVKLLVSYLVRGKDNELIKAMPATWAFVQEHILPRAIKACHDLEIDPQNVGLQGRVR